MLLGPELDLHADRVDVDFVVVDVVEGSLHFGLGVPDLGSLQRNLGADAASAVLEVLDALLDAVDLRSRALGAFADIGDFDLEGLDVEVDVLVLVDDADKFVVQASDVLEVLFVLLDDVVDLLQRRN